MMSEDGKKSGEPQGDDRRHGPRDDRAPQATRNPDAAPLHWGGGLVTGGWHTLNGGHAPSTPVSLPAAHEHTNADHAVAPVVPQANGGSDISSAGFPAPVDRREDGQEPPAGQELRRFHRMMRGRYKWAALLAVILGSSGAYAGYRLGVQTYQSTGTIRIAAVVPKVMYEVDEKGPIAMFDSFVEGQAAIIRSQRVMDLALTNPEWRKLNRGDSDDVRLEFADNLAVVRDGEMIWVRATDRDPTAAQIAVKTVIAAYEGIIEEADARKGDTRMGALQSRKVMLEAEMRVKEGAIKTIVEKYPTQDLGSLLAYELTSVQELEAMIAQVEAELKQLRDAPQTQAASQELTVEEIAGFDLMMQQLLQERYRTSAELRVLEVNGVPSGNPEFKRVKAMAERIEQEIKARAEEIRREQKGVVRINDGKVAPRDARVTALDHQLTFYRQMHGTAKDRLSRIGRDEGELRQLRADANDLKQKLAELDGYLEQLNIEKAIGGRVTVLSDGERPLGPHRDTRITFAAAGGLGGYMFGFGMIAALALLDRRVRTPEDAGGEEAGVAMLGLLPKLPDDLADPQQAATAAHCVHEIRTLLQLRTRGASTVLAVTSPNAGTGKTSLTLALGVSYALSGYRTLIIDADLVGGGLTTRLDAIVRRRIGKILRREGLVTQAQLDEALRLAHGSARRLGEILVELGYLSEHDLARAVMLQEEEPLGVLDALNGHALRECVTEVGISNLWALPLGTAGARHVATIAPDAVRRLIAAARRSVDVILIDTGPILGSLEASLITSIADGAILTVSKGEQKSLISRSIAQLKAVGAKMTGIVFNRASRDDISIYSSSSISSTRTSDSLAKGQLAFAPAVGAARLGPLAQAVASFAPAGDSGSRKA